MLDLSYDTPKPRVIAGAKHDWELVIGMEVHAQVASNAKLFSGASTKFGAEPNSNVAFVDAAMPGMLPVINEYCVEQAVRTGLGLKAEINLKSAFDRKNYFYPDLPQGYQISQLYEPIVGEGEVLVELGDGTARLVRIERIHMEQDAGKSIHDMDPNMSFVDLNRTGVCLMEIVSRPDIRGPEEAAAYLAKLRQIMRYLGTCNGDMQSGAMRADVNVSVCRVGQYEKYQETQDFSHLGTRCEIKNMNSMRFIQQAIEVEAKRQIAIVEAGGEVVQETRLFDPDKQETRSMRSKEEAHDYRYFPDPDLLPLEIEQAWVDDIKANLPELPDEKKSRFINDFGLSDYDASVLTADLDSADFFEKAVLAGVPEDAKSSIPSNAIGVATTLSSKPSISASELVKRGKAAANWVINELFGRLKKDDKGITESPVTPAQLGSIVDLIASDAISGKIAKEVFEIAYTTGREPEEIVETEGLKQVTDTGAIETAVDEIIAANPAQVEKAQQNPKLAGWFVGQVMKATGGKANPKAVNEIVSRKLAQQ
ncbi:MULTISPECIES: Asp-tRNA(Asn)/Glu-tRNA(Gln) amidotransferase subunit GatB [unclassified Sulfitobacter]|uniref:Asp-tRNA(Asn)/Glu-tRNA(Gln) amidotransferase subunit GatB n=1 Tax=unclassified Sulfitobacter TaxID=196795 RepID=UPI003744E60A